jgi:hypothetical protein
MPDPKDSLSKRTRRGLILLTIALYAVLLASALFSLPPRVHPIVSPIWFVALLLAGGACILNIALAIFTRDQRGVRRLHFYLAIMYAVLCSASLWTSQYHARARVAWFIREGHIGYDRMVGKVLQNRTALSRSDSVLLWANLETNRH